MEKQVYITKKEREKCRKVIDAFEELYEIEDEDILLVDAGRYGFVKLQMMVRVQCELYPESYLQDIKFYRIVFYGFLNRII